MKIALVTPGKNENCPNLGHNMITGGIIALLNNSCDNIELSYIEKLSPDPKGFDTARKNADLIIVCGNPRFNFSEETVYYDNELFVLLGQLADEGMPVIDAYPGSAYPLPLPSTEKIVQDLQGIRKNRKLAENLKKFKLIIARDTITHALLQAFNVPAIQLPDSSFWAARYYKILEGEKTIDIIIVLRSPGDPRLVEAILRTQRKLNESRPCYIVCINDLDYKWFTATAGISRQTVLVNTPGALLRMMATANQVLSFRVHASIPAVSVGCKVAHVSIDSRGPTCDPFSIPTVPLPVVYDPSFLPVFGGVKIDPAPTQAQFTKALYDRNLVINQ